MSFFLKPFDGWNAQKPSDLFWWKGYIDVKHGRSSCFMEASQENVVNALSALFILEMKYLSIITNEGRKGNDIPERESQLFIVPWSTHVHSIAELTFTYVDSE